MRKLVLINSIIPLFTICFSLLEVIRIHNERIMPVEWFCKEQAMQKIGSKDSYCSQIKQKRSLLVILL